MASLDREIDHLYQLPLSEFTKARDELARREESHRAVVRRLEKPSLPAWAVNQLYWLERGLYDALAAAAERLRRAQVAALAGKPADVEAIEAEHRAARKAAAGRIRKVLADSGEKATSATLTAINETLEALPTNVAAGRLVRPLKPMGFEGLTNLLKGDKIVAPRGAVVPFRSPSFRAEPANTKSAKRDAEAARAEKDARRHAEERKKRILTLTAQLHEAEAGERAANTALARAKSALAKAERDHHQAAARLEASAARVEDLSREARATERRASQAAITLADLKGQLKMLDGDHR